MTELVLAHLSDPHLTHLGEVRGRELLSKRVLGYLSWRTHRRHVHRSEVLDALLTDLRGVAADQVVVTGDLTHIGLPQEFRQAAAWLPRIGAPDRVFVIPGNHDAYRWAPWSETFALWAPYLASDPGAPAASTDGRAPLPTLRVRNGVALIGLSTARPSPPFMATGRIGRAQLEALGDMLRTTGERGLFRVLLIHHPPVPGSIRWRKRLTDAPALGAVLAERGVELVLHGHAHRDSRLWLPTPAGRAPVIGVRSASMHGPDAARRAQYHVFRISRRGRGWNVRLSVREYAPEEHRFTPVGAWEVDSPGPRERGTDSDREKEMETETET
ncbi:MAG: metallophosphoesterase [Gammaproteobacteria bacterium]|nr:metallophosphoesterase [Gammaproteobacteria bacterium]